MSRTNQRHPLHEIFEGILASHPDERERDDLAATLMYLRHVSARAGGALTVEQIAMGLGVTSITVVRAWLCKLYALGIITPAIDGPLTFWTVDLSMRDPTP